MNMLSTSGPARISETITHCRACGKSGFVPFLDLGSTPLADRLLTQEQLDAPEPRVPLEVVFCPHCTLVQITETVHPAVLFGGDYPYFSSVSPSLLAHFRASALHLPADAGTAPHPGAARTAGVRLLSPLRPLADYVDGPPCGALRRALLVLLLGVAEPRRAPHTERAAVARGGAARSGYPGRRG